MYKKQSWKIMKAVLKSLKAGSSINAACQAAKITTPTLWEWRKRQPRLDMLVKCIYESRVQIVEDALYKGALDGNVTSQIFFLKNRQPNRWRDAHDIKGEGFNGNNTINVFPSRTIVFKDMTPDEYEATRITDVSENSERSLSQE
jgi:hypothetical protein